MADLRPGWSLALFGAALAVSSWLPWLTTSAGGGGRASAIGGTVGSLELPPRFGAGQLIALLAPVLIVVGALVGRGLAPRLAAVAGVAVSLLAGVLTWWYYHVNVHSPVDAGYGFYVGAACVLGAVLTSLWSVVDAMFGTRPDARR